MQRDRLRGMQEQGRPGASWRVCESRGPHLQNKHRVPQSSPPFRALVPAVDEPPKILPSPTNPHQRRQQHQGHSTGTQEANSMRQLLSTAVLQTTGGQQWTDAGTTAWCLQKN